MNVFSVDGGLNLRIHRIIGKKIVSTWYCILFSLESCVKCWSWKQPGRDSKKSGKWDCSCTDLQFFGILSCGSAQLIYQAHYALLIYTLDISTFIPAHNIYIHGAWRSTESTLCSIWCVYWCGRLCAALVFLYLTQENVRAQICTHTLPQKCEVLETCYSCLVALHALHEQERFACSLVLCGHKKEGIQKNWPPTAMAMHVDIFIAWGNHLNKQHWFHGSEMETCCMYGGL